MSGLTGRPGVTDFETADGLLDEASGFFSLFERAFDALGFGTAAENPRQYRSGQGGTRLYGRRDRGSSGSVLMRRTHIGLGSRSRHSRGRQGAAQI